MTGLPTLEQADKISFVPCGCVLLVRSQRHGGEHCLEKSGRSTTSTRWKKDVQHARVGMGKFAARLRWTRHGTAGVLHLPARRVAEDASEVSVESIEDRNQNSS